MDDFKLTDYSYSSSEEAKNQSEMEKQAGAIGNACRVLFERFGGQLVLYVVKLGLDEDQANEVVSSVFVHIWEKRKTVEILQMEKPQAYLYKAVYNRFLDYQKKTGRERRESLEYMAGLMDRQDETYSERWSIRGRIAAAMSILTEQQRLAVLAIRFQGKTHEETAAEMGISASTVKKHLKVALSKLRKNLKELYTIVIFISLLMP